jgi:hypothetical protein
MIANADGDVRQLVDSIFDSRIIQRMTMNALSAEQRASLDGLPDPVRALAYEWVMSAMQAAARSQVAFCCQVGISQPALDGLVRDAQAEVVRRRTADELANRLVGAGAGFPVVRSLLGIGKEEFDHLRQVQGVSSTPANRVRIGDAESTSIYRRWVALGSRADAEGFLALHHETGQPIQVLWGLVQDWRYALNTIKAGR